MEKTILRAVLNSIFIIIFNIVFFLIGGFEHKVSAWISYGFIHFAYLMLLITPRLIREAKSAAVFEFPLYLLSSIYFLSELAVGVAFILFSPDSYKIALLVQLCIAGLYGAAFISNMIANEHTAEADENRQYQVDYIKKASTELKSMLEHVDDAQTKKIVVKAYEEIYASPVKSHPNLAQKESQILMSIGSLREAIFSENKEEIIALADSILIAINERNKQLKTLN
jgi:hypothetical protein